MLRRPGPGRLIRVTAELFKPIERPSKSEKDDTAHQQTSSIRVNRTPACRPHEHLAVGLERELHLRY